MGKDFRLSRVEEDGMEHRSKIGFVVVCGSGVVMGRGSEVGATKACGSDEGAEVSCS